MKQKQLYAFLTSFFLVATSCSVGTQHEHTYSNEWSYNDTYHWHAATCGHNVIINKEEHSFTEWEIDVEPTAESDGHAFRTCEICEYTQEAVVEPSGPVVEPDLIFVLNSDGLSYTVGGYNEEATSIEIPESLMGLPVTRIAENAFKNFKSLETISIPDSIVELGKNAFLGCDSLTFNDIDNAHYLGNESNPYLIFHSLINTEVTEFSFREGCRFAYAEINKASDYGQFKNVETLRIPCSLRYFFDNMLSNTANTTTLKTSKYKDIYFDGTINEWASVEFADVSNNDSLITFHFTDVTTEENMSLTLNESVKSIGKFAFTGFKIDTLTIPSSVKHFGKSAFKVGLLEYNPVAKSINYLGSINDWAHIEFENETATPKKALNTIRFNGEKVTEFVSDGSMTEVLPYSFYYFEDLVNVTLGETITKVGERAFYANSRLETYTISKNIKLFDESCFANTYPSIVNYDGTVSDWLDVELRSTSSNVFSLIGSYPESFSDIDLTGCFKIGDYQFYKHKSINSVSNTSGIESVGMYAFCQSNIASIELPNVVKVYDSAFANCTSLTNVSLSEQTNYIGKNAFRKTGITSFVVPNLVTELREYSFAECPSLATFTFGSNIKSIYSCALCSDVSHIIYLGTLADWCNIEFVKALGSSTYIYFNYQAANYSKEFTLTINGEDNIKNVVIPDGVTYISENTFLGWTWVESFTIPASVSNVSLRGFNKNAKVYWYTNNINECLISNYDYVHFNVFDNTTKQEIKTIDITSELDSSSWHVQCNDSVETINIHTDVNKEKRYIYHYVENCPNLKTINILDGVKDVSLLYLRVDPSVTINIGKDLETFSDQDPNDVTCYFNVDPLNTHFSSLDGCLYNKDKTELFHFYSEYEGEWVTPDTLVTIPYHACSGAKKLTSVVLGSSVLHIESSAFYSCNKLESVTFNDSLLSIGERAFESCLKLGDIVLPDSVEEIGMYAIEGNVNCPKNLKRVGICNVTSTVDEENKRYWGDSDNPRRVLLWLNYRDFETYTEVTESTISEGCEIISDRAGIADSYAIINMTRINLPHSIKTIGYRAFYNFSKLEDLYYNGTMEEWNAITKYEEWNKLVPATAVHCLDGDVSLA